jgi:outer membrane protein OmpA-like peptidoglycan-associated protein
MSVSSNSDDASDIFWPGYVDAVTNLAINLLFVIAVMSIVVLAATLQIAELSKRKATLGPTPAETTPAGTPEFTLAELQDDLRVAQANLKSTQARLVESQQKIKQSEATQIPAATPSPSSSSTSASASPIARTETVAVAAPKTPASTEAVSLQDVSGGLVVNFAKDAITLTSAESSEIVTKLATFGNLRTNRWLITVISPKGFSEALRLSYYRANTVRNVLIENGVVGGAIDLKIQESSQAGANNAKVLVKLQP